jgi:hypothetical protein
MQITNCRTAPINASIAGSNPIVPAPGGAGGNINGAGFGDITVWQVQLNGSGANTLQFQSGSTNIGSPIVYTGAGAATTLQATGVPWFKCAAGQALNLNLANTSTVTGTVFYTLG